MIDQQAPKLQIETWLNSDAPVTLESLRGRVVLIEAFQLLCPGCVSHGLPQATLVSQTFSSDDVVVLGLHCVFEHHSAQGRKDVLAGFLHENRIRFPVGMDLPSSNSAIPKTMAAYDLRGTPSTILIDRSGNLRATHFGRIGDMALGAEIEALVVGGSQRESLSAADGSMDVDTDCDEDGCRVGAT